MAEFDKKLIKKFLYPFGTKVYLAGISASEVHFIVLNNNLDSLESPKNLYELKNMVGKIEYELAMYEGSDGKQKSVRWMKIPRLSGHKQIPCAEIWRISSLVPYVRGRIEAIAEKPRKKEAVTKEEKVAELFKAELDKTPIGFDPKESLPELADFETTFMYYLENPKDLTQKACESLNDMLSFLAFAENYYPGEVMAHQYIERLRKIYSKLHPYIKLAGERRKKNVQSATKAQKHTNLE